MRSRAAFWAAALLAVACGRSAVAADPLVIAAILSESPPPAGVAARLLRAGMEAAIAVANAEDAGKRQPVRLVIRDDGGVLARSGEAVERAVADDKAIAVLGGQTSAMGLAQIAAGARATQLSSKLSSGRLELRVAGVA